MVAKETSKVTFVIGQILEEMQGERWAELRLILSTKGLQALIAATSLEETRIIQAKVAEYCQPSPPPPPDDTPLFVRFQRALQDGIAKATQLPWPALHHKTFDA